MSGRSPFTNDAIWKGAVETIGMPVKQSANKCGIGVDTARQMRRVLRGQMGITPKMKPPPEIVAHIPYADQQPLNPDVRAAAAREVTAEANAASRINEVSPVVTRRKHKSHMTVENLIYIAGNMHKYPTELGKTLGHSPRMVACWKEILAGELEPGPRRYNQVSRPEIRQIQADFQTIPAMRRSTVAPVGPLLHGHSKMTLEVLIAIAKSMDLPAQEIGRRLSMSATTVIVWRDILSGWSEPGPQQRARIPVDVISQVQQDFQTISATPNPAETLQLPPESEQAMTESLSSLAPEKIAAALQLTPRDEMNAIVEHLLALAERVEKLVPLIEDADEAIRKLATLRTTLGE
mgnify:CR=1 FL=1